MKRGLVFAACVAAAGCAPAPTPPPVEQPAPPPAPEVSAITVAEGLWSVADEAGIPFDFVLFANGQAVSTRVNGPLRARGQRGLWRLMEGRLVVLLSDGWCHVIASSAGGFSQSAFAPGSPKAPAYQSAAVRHEDDRAALAGVWQLNKEPDGNFLYITLRHDGSAFSTIGGLTAGTWQVVNGSARCQWPDGWTDQIGIEHGAWTKRSWVGGDESTPADFSQAQRVGEQPFEIAP